MPTAGPDAQNHSQKSGSSGDGRGPTRPEAEYIASMLEGLKQLAAGAQLPFLAYLIGVALEEARNDKSGQG